MILIMTIPVYFWTLRTMEMFCGLNKVNMPLCLCACVCVSLLLESGTVESHCSEGGIGDVTAAGHTQDLQLVASSAQTDQAFVCDLLKSRHTHAHSK